MSHEEIDSTAYSTFLASYFSAFVAFWFSVFFHWVIERTIRRCRLDEYMNVIVVINASIITLVFCCFCLAVWCFGGSGEVSMDGLEGAAGLDGAAGAAEG